MTDCAADISRDCGPTSEGSFLCPACTRVLRNDLRELPGLAFDLEVTLTRMRGTDYASRGEGGHGGEKPLPIHAWASELRWVLRNTLSTWARLLVEERGARYGDYVDSPSIARWLGLYVDEIAAAKWAGQCASEIHSDVEAVHRCVDAPGDRVYLGPCNGVGRIGPDGTPEPAPAEMLAHDETVCGADLYVDPEASHGRCPGCGTTYSVKMRGDWIIDMHRGRLVTTTEAASLLHIATNTIDKWASRKRLTVKSERKMITRSGAERTIRFYLLDDIIELSRPRHAERQLA